MTANALPVADSGPVPADDRREHPRYALSLAITMRGENNFYAGLSENISETGVFIATSHVLAIGTPVVLSFTLPSSDQPISVVGRVQWLRGPNAMANAENNFGGDVAGVKPGMGVCFSEVDPKAVRAIRSFMLLRLPDFFVE
jgi:uncharacterized protein (TIGR02266 family)